ncbi:MAG: type IV pili twitching motility protein PilT [Candidatus Portnoybacteria bacterium CG10_big_fil_rev_8_21_14_0_10_38_18]|uniref:Type IV pili twitching motility protein PilT n=1 Tax=Candidatus Portnoybacteria bacterium CG10_big_fil_rev_8_21_14_0_10_38_18 TaxID=1974813 RepID=A0A2M8KC71_9BACT|nr:MAG: type IV pili twitching motility protein PilT [Candidatus Portnoybacteria bacterium CG10_big_fil_rev_8_21_14_0_10_38_18]
MKNNYQTELEEFLEIVAKHNASDLHFSVGKRPAIRVDGQLTELTKYPILSGEHAEGLIYALLTEEQKQRVFSEKELDFSYSYKEKARFRINVFYQRGYLSAALRFLPPKIKTVKELNLPQFLEKFAAHSQGFFLVVGPTGHGKTTTLAALIDYINHHFNKHIVTIEDPIEYIFEQDKCLIEQREVGSDTKSFARALRSALRQDPDVIMVGEMRDLETISTALTAAETGHLVLATLHTNNAAQTIDRIIDSFPAEAKNQVRAQLAATLLGVVSERLIPRVGGGRIPAIELMIANSAVRNLIREGKIYQIDLVIETSMDQGMMSLNRYLSELVHKEQISVENAELYSLNPSDLKMLLGK